MSVLDDMPGAPLRAAADNILVYGLSANPVHLGHISLAVQATQALAKRNQPVARILLLPVYRRNPVGVHKDDLPSTYPQRFAMCALAAQDIRRAIGTIPVEVSQIEADLAQLREAPNFTVETLSALRARMGSVTLRFLISSELVAGESPELSRWHQVDTLFGIAELVICSRAGYTTNAAYLARLRAAGARILELPEVHPPDIASEDLRRRLRSGTDPLALVTEGLLSDAVATFLRDQRLYSA